ncbi:hypothetical protein BB560_002037 [Smittium megazygosporum]|uniref:Roadblock/LAMTOR2 domain-containing protein n=1 Tax=Smittium megazygosporum TaxID=133381 RepID=A0A2T9ZFW5_9FUNG|nr:hypothetical protein BB560_002037 [Smittium megazygosporum]
MILQAKILKQILDEALTGDAKLCVLFTNTGILLSEAHASDFTFKQFVSESSPGSPTIRRPNKFAQIPSSYGAFDSTTASENQTDGFTTHNRMDSLGTDLEPLDVNESIRSYVAIMATLWRKYYRLKYYVSSFENEENEPSSEYFNDLNVFYIESSNLKTAIVPLHEHLVLLAGPTTILPGLLKAKAIEIRNQLSRALEIND